MYDWHNRGWLAKSEAWEVNAELESPSTSLLLLPLSLIRPGNVDVDEPYDDNPAGEGRSDSALVLPVCDPAFDEFGAVGADLDKDKDGLGGGGKLPIRMYLLAAAVSGKD
ncbi:hypothetical protein L198_04911 [Cryptococcus wingfieldii CBS 7118]|uniref:Uncharacterized protein n=1 Tax=Cryptococcus wingfieldii CBS 7118 TaxID=1295528 RepID=A0A1E3J1M3_9TREE|nr:hypothetical protein L198_04911 [Cryptococcus wingfieldii CBS 7118]ODN94767.1 hypothetical protein L198_04911 [Cryptococcus wingfieldii CBS 7118]